MQTKKPQQQHNVHGNAIERVGNGITAHHRCKERVMHLEKRQPTAADIKLTIRLDSENENIRLRSGLCVFYCVCAKKTRTRTTIFRLSQIRQHTNANWHIVEEHSAMRHTFLYLFNTVATKLCAIRSTISLYLSSCFYLLSFISY